MDTKTANPVKRIWKIDGVRKSSFALSITTLMLMFLIPFILLVLLLTSSAALAADATQAVSGAALVAALRSAKIIDPAFKLTATISGDEVLVNTQRKLKSTDNDCKIQAVLIGKTAFDVVPTDIQRIKVMFFDYEQGSYSEVSVRRSEVKLFGAGQLSEKQLLASLEMKSTTMEDSENASTEVAAGPMQPSRMIALGRIQRLKKQGTDVSKLEKMFAQAEESAKTNNVAALRQQIRDLNNDLKEQEQAVKLAQDSENRLQVEGSRRQQQKPADGSAGNANARHGHNDELSSSDPNVEKRRSRVKQAQTRIEQRLQELNNRGYKITYYQTRMQEAAGYLNARQFLKYRQELFDIDNELDRYWKQLGL